MMSSINQKVVMAVTGLILLGFVLGHLCGNLLIFAGPDALNAYAKKLRDLGPLLWVVRIGLLLALVLHVATAARLAAANRLARPQGYVFKNTVQATLSSRTMLQTGLVVLAFIIFHLAHFTFFWVHPEYAGLHDTLGRHDVYAMEIAAFGNLFVSGVYITAMAVLAFHLFHGVSVFLQTAGLMNHRHLKLFKCIGHATAALIFVGYASIPIAVLTGLVGRG